MKCLDYVYITPGLSTAVITFSIMMLFWIEADKRKVWKEISAFHPPTFPPPHFLVLLRCLSNTREKAFPCSSALPQLNRKGCIRFRYLRAMAVVEQLWVDIDSHNSTGAWKTSLFFQVNVSVWICFSASSESCRNDSIIVMLMNERWVQSLCIKSLVRIYIFIKEFVFSLAI